MSRPPATRTHTRSPVIGRKASASRLPPPARGLAHEVRFDCVHFRSDRPCIPHKQRGVHCATCDAYRPQGTRILMIKLEAIGDVLRTTCLLPAMAARWPGMQLTWVTNPEAAPLLRGNPYVHRIVPAPLAVPVLLTESFDLAINLDSSPRSSALMTMARAKDRRGYLLDPRGFVYPAGERERPWFVMGLFDDVKKANTRTYQALMAEILEVDPALCRYVLVLEDAERAWARDFAREAGMPPPPPGPSQRPVIGLNTGAGGRWQYKRWRMDGYLELIRRLKSERDASILLLGGADEELENRQLAARASGGSSAQAQPGAAAGIFVSGSHPVRRFSAIVGLCNAVVTGDTLGMHIALALGVPVVALFGPTSRAEIDLYGAGRSIAPPMDCLVCYLEHCDKKPACMDLIEVDHVARALDQIL